MISLNKEKTLIFLAWLEDARHFLPRSLKIVEAMALFERKYEEEKLLKRDMRTLN